MVVHIGSRQLGSHRFPNRRNHEPTHVTCCANSFVSEEYMFKFTLFTLQLIFSNYTQLVQLDLLRYILTS